MRNVPGEGDCMFLAVALAAATSSGMGGNDAFLRALSKDTRNVVAQVLGGGGESTHRGTESRIGEDAAPFGGEGGGDGPGGLPRATEGGRDGGGTSGGRTGIDRALERAEATDIHL